MRKKIVSDEEDEQDPVIDGTLDVKVEGSVRNVQLNLKVFTEDGHVEKDEWFFLDWRLFDIVFVCFYFFLSGTLRGVMSLLPA